MSRVHCYRHLDDDHEDRQGGSRLTVRLTTREVAEQIESMNYGTHRLLSHLIDVRRERRAAEIAEYRDLPPPDCRSCAAREART